MQTTTSTSTRHPGRADILYVEDDAELRETVCGLLRDEGYAVDGAVDGREALDYLHRSPAPGLILLDMQMPVMDGREFLEHVSEEPDLAGTPITVISGAVRTSILAGPRGIEFRLAKPFDTESLLAVVRRSLGTRVPA
jgi:CheY-like chemotaxis protein